MKWQNGLKIHCQVIFVIYVLKKILINVAILRKIWKAE
nr:MAG TPA: hypothetical protein [Caudoviricetes sp.]DAI22564.1 MAG TPA: hypothetical protein [Caudoviricetes sp.]